MIWMQLAQASLAGLLIWQASGLWVEVWAAVGRWLEEQPSSRVPEDHGRSGLAG